MGSNGKDNKGNIFAPIADAIQKVVDGLDDNLFIEFAGSFVIFDEKKLNDDADDVIHDSIMFAYGVKDSLSITLEAMVEEIEKEKDDFVNW